MVRAAVSGAINYSDADPDDKKWRIKHRLIISEISRRDRQQVLERYHSHLCSYLSHSRLTETSFEKLKTDANTAYAQVRNVVYPWLETEEKENETKPQESKIDANTRAMIERYRAYSAQFEQK